MFLLQDCVPGPFGWYVVRDGDTLASVCAAQGAAYASLIAVNRLQKFPPPGSLLCLPPRERVYTVRPGDTAESICARFSADRAEFLRRNGPVLYPTQRVCLGGAEGEAGGGTDRV